MNPTSEQKTINIFGLPGSVNPITDYELVAWFWENQARTQKNKSRLTCFWLDLYDNYWSDLYKFQAYELLALLKSKTTVAQKKARQKGRQERKAKNDAQMLALGRRVKLWKERRNLIVKYIENVN